MKTTSYLLILVFFIGFLTACSSDPDDPSCEEGSFRANEDATCTAWSVCTAGEYERAAPTATSDRECASYTVCADGEYQRVAPTATSDRACAPLTVCNENEYERAAPTATSDRECEKLTICRGSEVEEVPPTAESDRVCAIPPGCERSDQIVWDDVPVEDGEEPLCCYLYANNLTVKTRDGWPDMSHRGEHCLVFDGDLTLSDEASEPPVPVLRVNGNVTVKDIERSDLMLLEGLTHIGKTLRISSNDILVNLAGLESLTEIGGALALNNNSALVNFVGLDNVETIGDFVAIAYHLALTDLQGLEALTSIGGYLYMAYNPSFASLDALRNLTSVGSYIWFMNNVGLCTDQADAIANQVDLPIVREQPLEPEPGIAYIRGNGVAADLTCE